MKTLHLLRSALFSLVTAASIGVAHAQTYDGSPYTAWANDYSGSESHTLLLWKFDNPSPRVNSAGAGYTVNPSVPAGDEPARAVPGVEGGKFGEALIIPERKASQTDFVQAASSYSLFSPSAMSVEFWFRPLEDGVASGNLAYFFDKQYTTKYGLQLRLDNTDSKALGALSFLVGNGVDSNLSLKTGGLEWNADQWYHVAVTFELIGDDATIKIFRDGQQLGSRIGEGFGPMVNSVEVTGTDAKNYFWRLGNRLGSSYGSTPGYFDNFRISDVAYQYAAPIPEPSVTAILGLTGLGLLLAAHSRRKNKP